MALKVLNHYLLIKPDEREYVSENPEVTRILKEGTLVVPEAYEGSFLKSPMSGHIIGFGDRCKYPYEDGQTIVFRRFSGVPFEFNGTKYYFITEEDVLATIYD